MRAFYIIFVLAVVFSCKSAEEKEKEILQNKISNRADSLLLFSSKITEEFLVKNQNVECADRKKNFKQIQKTYNQIASNYKEQTFLLKLPEDTVRYRLGMANKVLQNKEMAECVGLGKGYDQFQYFLTQLKLEK